EVIVLNMFIAVIQENFDVSEDEKRLQQVKAFLAKRQVNATSGSQGSLSLSTIFKLGQVRRQDPLDYGSAQTEMLLKDAVVRDFLDDHAVDPDASLPSTADNIPNNSPPVKSGTLVQRWEQLLNRLFNREPNPFYSNVELQKAHEEVDTRQMVKEVVAANERVKRAQREYLRKYPNYNVSLFIFRINNPVRRLCQRIVGPGRGGNRIEGVAPSRPIWYGFSAFIYAAIVAMVLLACVTTPLYQKEYFRTHHFQTLNWFVYSDMGFAALFTIESMIRVIADGFYWTPNAYYRSSWGIIDGIVLVTLWTDIFTTIYNPGGGSRAVGAFKALRALRLLNVSENARDTFHSVIVMGGWKVVSAAFVSMSLLIPFAIYGLNLFNGRFMECNDGNGVTSLLTDCTGEYLSSPYNWNVLAPRQVANPYYDFDNFGSALFILFQIVSQEGWIDVMWSGQSITGVFTQPNSFASQGNAVFFVAFNLLGAVFVLTLFVSVFMRNYTEQTGVAFLKTEQRSWLELRKLLRQISPSKRPSSKEVRQTWREWCYRRAVTKNGKWQRSVTLVLVFHLLLLCLEWYPDNDRWDRARDYIFLVLTLFYIVNIVIRIIGLSWTRFRRSAWDVYSLFAVSGSFVTLVLLLTNFKNRDYVQVHKLFLVSIALLLIPRNNQLDQLFKTAAASFTSIANLVATWFVLFLVFAIAFTQTFGLTRFAEGETDNQNFRTVPKALVMLFRMSSGEGWNEVMADFASVTPPYCTIGEHYYDGDCGSDGWSMALFISWNILSMYVFMNLFISLIYESFSYVYQRSSGLSVISREEIRRYKQAWAEFDPSGSGYISKEKFPRLLGELSGVFEMRIYDGDFTVSNIIADCTSRPQRAHPLGLDGPKDSSQIDLEKLNERLSEIPIHEIQRRRKRMNIFYEEVLVSADPDRGVEFNSLLMILAHYKVINDNKSLRLEEFLRRRARLQRVEEAVRRNVVVGFFDTLYWARRFRKALEAKKNARMTMVPQLDVPEIFIQDDSGDADDSGRKSTSAPSTPVEYKAPDWTIGSEHSTPALTIDPTASRPNLRNRSGSIQVSPSASPTRSRAVSHSSPSGMRDIPEDWHFAEALIEGHNRSRSPSPSPQHLDPDTTSDAYGGLGLGAGPRSRAQTLSASGPESRPRAGTLSVAGTPSAGGRSRAASSVNAQNVLDVLDTSAWGESIRRSFTTRGSTIGPHGSAVRDTSVEPMPSISDTQPPTSSHAEGHDHEHPHER
ncbi:calcium channel-like protein subunit Cch1, partial [Aureobasidium melanogenum]